MGLDIRIRDYVTADPNDEHKGVYRAEATARDGNGRAIHTVFVEDDDVDPTVPETTEDGFELRQKVLKKLLHEMEDEILPRGYGLTDLEREEIVVREKFGETGVKQWRSSHARARTSFVKQNAED